ncbi:hypothetical protein HQO24_10205 [Rhodococcus fascians]|nr:hypothetical protein [Rhodococcus fascians]MBY4396948.1 hypothetical protein [Rhodococcus fascians]MBY4407427.1 hypothetical protein [Rhodococcus fascians]MBY4421444.1 hypothetical protein [Rhodococcus fascians]MBY4460803.1 hypothetical protein [Rhodococcus fascians]
MTDANTTVVSAVSATRSGSVSVRATEHGVPIAIAIDERELRYGGTALASTILDRCTRATAAARAQRRIRLAEDGVPADILDRLGLPTHARTAADANDDLAQEPAPTSWLRPV